jgi:guanylate kinase
VEAGRGHIFVLVGPGGSGKTTLIRALIERRPHVRFIPTATTRKPRPGEVSGHDYFFLTEAEFDRMIGDGALMEWQTIHGHRYGTIRSEFQAVIDRGEVGITSLDYKGAFVAKRTFADDVTTVFVRAGSADDLEDRLAKRPGATSEEIAARLERAEEEYRYAEACDAEVVNRAGALDEAVARLDEIVARHGVPAAEA